MPYAWYLYRTLYVEGKTDMIFGDKGDPGFGPQRSRYYWNFSNYL